MNHFPTHLHAPSFEDKMHSMRINKKKESKSAIFAAISRTWNFHTSSSSFLFHLLMISDVDRHTAALSQKTPTPPEMVGKFLSCCRKLNQANFHLSFHPTSEHVSTYSQHWDMFQKLNICFQLHCLFTLFLFSLLFFYNLRPQTKSFSPFFFL